MPARRRSALLFKLAVHRTGSSQQGILDELRRVILDGAVPPGTPIPISEIAELFGVSNIPVRESLKTLKGEGLVQHRPNIGYAVAQLTASELAEMYIVRETLESAALAAAVARATDADREHVAEVNRLLEKAVREDDPPGLPSPKPAFPYRSDPAVAHASTDSHARICLEHHRTRPVDGARRAVAPRTAAPGPPAPARCVPAGRHRKNCCPRAPYITGASTAWSPHCRPTPG